MKRLCMALVFLGLSSLSIAQTAIPTSKFAWDQSAPTLADANNYTYKLYTDGSVTSATLSGVVCSGTTNPFVCTVNVPAFAPGSHAVQFTATNVAGESAKSAIFSFTMVIQPAAPANVRIQ